MNGQPFNLLKNPPAGGLPVVVTKGKMATWASERGRRHPGLDGLGELCYGGASIAGPVEWWMYNYDPRPDYPKFYNASDQRIYPGNDQRNPPGADKFCTRKVYLRRACDRILIAQNCYVENGGLVIPDNYQWYAPRTGRFAHDFTFENESALGVRPWCGPGGDIESWATEPYASFLPFTWRFGAMLSDWEPASGEDVHEHGNVLNIAAYELWKDGEAPASWGLDGGPIYRVQYLNTGLVDGDNAPYSNIGCIDEAKEYILNPDDVDYYTMENGRPVLHHGPLPFKVIKWAKIQEDSDLEGWREWLDGDTIIQDHLDVPTNGDAFDLMVYTISYHEVEKQWSGGHEWGDGGWGAYQNGGEVARWFRAVARIVKPLPPIQEGGA